MTCKRYYEIYKKRAQEILNSKKYETKPCFLFRSAGSGDLEEWLFDVNNWCGCDILRFFVNALYDDDQMPSLPGFEFRVYCEGNSVRVFFFGKAHYYEMCWDKDSPRTTSIEMDGHLITLGEYIELYNRLTREDLCIGG